MSLLTNQPLSSLKMEKKIQQTEPFILGVDIGSVSVSVVELSLQEEVLRCHYAFHNGEILKTLTTLLAEVEFPLLQGVACTSATPNLLRHANRFDSRIACITAAKHCHHPIGSLLTVGGEKFNLITFDPHGNYRNLKTNTSCAAGTGSFLDQQARRLNLPDSAALSQLALQNTGSAPKIASRCSVFAKTDIVHAQQTGYTLEEICAGLCKGLADNIADILLSDEEVPGPIVFSGGVAKNKAVLAYLEERIGKPLLTHELSHVYDALGAALLLLEEVNYSEPGTLPPQGTFETLEQLLGNTAEKKEYFYEPLSLELSRHLYPEFKSSKRYLYTSEHTGPANPVEVDIYTSYSDEMNKHREKSVYMGFDIGSTSTKAVLLESSSREVLAGFYTRTAGQPIKAVQAILETIAAFSRAEEISFIFEGVGTTGSGRKFVGEIIGADIMPDEITAHARAAYELNPETDTIIEIGGQDAKFTTLRNGLVTFSQMNTVCAAGTGSFLEEQAEKLEVPLSEFSALALGARAPLVSDRCTVFMERDINRFLNKKYSIPELLAASLFAVRENYLLKVATEGNIGDHICFQGATAKNRALVAAFEQKLQKPIYVSKYCHLTGALGTALLLAAAGHRDTHFRGLEIHRQEIPVRTEICELCRNHCRLRVAVVNHEEVAYGFLCGRDYNTQRFIDKNKSGFDLLKEHEKAFAIPGPVSGSVPPQPPESTGENKPFTIGIPTALHLFEDLPFWKFFFKELGNPVITGAEFPDMVKTGKKLAGAEFCSPLNAFHGCARYLSDRADCLFLPIYLEERYHHHKSHKEHTRKFCYYTQFSSTLVSLLEQEEKGIPCIFPLVGAQKSSLSIKVELYKSLSEVVPRKLSFLEVFLAYDRAMDFLQAGKKKLTEIYRDQEKESSGDDIRVVLVGRPYTVLSPAMNKGIPGIFASLGIKTYFQDMLPIEDEEGTAKEIAGLLEASHWKFAARILESAQYAAQTGGLYPVYVTSFRCAPDSFTIEYFKRILEAKGKPYLILQLDEHDSNVGYETRIEAGVRSFRNHFASSVFSALSTSSTSSTSSDTADTADTADLVDLAATAASSDTANLVDLAATAVPGLPGNPASVLSPGTPPLPVSPTPKETLPINPRLEKDLTGKTLLFPNWDHITSPLLVANLQAAGIDARLLEEDDTVIRESMRMNTGQCIPLNAIALECIRYVNRHRFDPGKTLLWMSHSRCSCNIGMYAYYIKSVFEAQGKGMEKMGVYIGDISHFDISPLVVLHTYLAYLFGGVLRKLGCQVRPYELEKGKTDQVIKKAIEIFTTAFENRKKYSYQIYMEAVEEALAMFSQVKLIKTLRPKVAVFGDLYMRDNDVMNQDLLRFIEDAGGEVITTPYNEYIKIISTAYFEKCLKVGRYLELIKFKPIMTAIEFLEKKYFVHFEKFIGKPVTGNPEFADIFLRFHMRLEQGGESWENILKIFHILKAHPDISLFVQTNPAFCCPALITEAQSRDIQRITGVPIVTLTYDGTGTPINDRIIPYLKYPANPAGRLINTNGCGSLSI